MTDRLLKSLRTGKALRLLLLLALVLPLVASTPVANAATRVQPVLLQMATAHPDSKVDVIVQKTTSNSSVEQMVVSMGGRVTKDLHIINGFAAEMPGKAVLQLAKMAEVRWVSLDGATWKATTDPTEFITWATDIATPVASSIQSAFSNNPYVNTPTVTSTRTPSNTPTITNTPTISPTPTITPTPTNTPTITLTATPSNTPTITLTRTFTRTSTRTITRTFTVTPTVTRTPARSNTPTVTHTPTQTGTITRTPTDTPMPSNTPTVTDTPTITDTPANTNIPTDTPTVTFTATPTNTPTTTNTRTNTNTPTVTNTPTITLTRTPTNTATYVPLANTICIPMSSTNTIWFNSTFLLSGPRPSSVVKVYLTDSKIEFSANGTSYSLSAPDAVITYDPAITTTTTTFDASSNRWLTTAPAQYSNINIFLSGLAFQRPVGLPDNITPVTWSGRFKSDGGGVSVRNGTWRWGAAGYSSFSSNYNALGVKPLDGSAGSQYLNGDKAGTPENFKSSLVIGQCSTFTSYVGGYTSGQDVAPMTLFHDYNSMMDAPTGPNDTFGSGSNIKMSFSGFAAEVTPGHAISRVEIVLRAYVPYVLVNNNDTPVIKTYVGGQAGTSLAINNHAFDVYLGPSHAGTVYADITSTRTWHWADFDSLELEVDQSSFTSADFVYYDAVGLRVTSVDGTDPTGTTRPPSLPRAAINLNLLLNTYDRAVRATNVWNEAPGYLQGQGMTVAVIDSGIFNTTDLKKRVVRSVNYNPDYHSSMDAYGHGTFVAGVIAGDGKYSNGTYIGIAPKAELVNVRVSNDQGMATESDVLSGLQWVYDNRTRYDIKVVNMSLNAANAQSYHNSPLDAGVEILWFSGVTVVVSAGNNGTANLYPPANDPFVITVGATDDRGTTNLIDDAVAGFSAYGTAEDGTAKPDLVAPGKGIIALLPSNNQLTISQQHPEFRIGANYFRMSGTSMSAPMVAGAVALLLQDEPTLTPDQIKYRLKATAATQWPGYDTVRAGAGYLDVYAAVHSTSTQSANTGTTASQMLWTGNQPVNWGSVNWGSVNWGSVNWGSVNWGSVNWGSVNWGSDTWTP